MSTEFALQKARREHMRWLIILTLNNARPLGAYENLILTVARAEYPDATELEMRKELSYLHDRRLIALHKEPDGRHHAKLTRKGVDLAEYTEPCDSGIARPERYW